jgi:hypothetical protein
MMPIANSAKLRRKKLRRKDLRRKDLRRRVYGYICFAYGIDIGSKIARYWEKWVVVLG